MFINQQGIMKPHQETAIELVNSLKQAEITKKMLNAPHLAIVFPAFSDGRGFTLAKRLRRLGYKGGLTAKGALIPDQFDAAFIAGFDAVEIDEARASRQPLEQWLSARNLLKHSYQDDIFALRHKE